MKKLIQFQKFCNNSEKNRKKNSKEPKKLTFYGKMKLLMLKNPKYPHRKTLTAFCSLASAVRRVLISIRNCSA